MIRRILSPNKGRSFFLLGARSTGKTSLLNVLFDERVARFDLLKPDLFRELQKRPERFVSLLPKNRKRGDWIIIDEIQRVPDLLNIVHGKIEEEKLKFALTGSSARKLRRSGANLLGGRALIYSLFPFTHRELGDQFDLDQALEWGTLPVLLEAVDTSEKKRILDAYVDTFIREEVREEQIIRKLDPFLRFLEVSAQMDGKIINAAKIASDAQTEPRTVLRYYEIMEDTLLGKHLDAYHRSIRKAQRQAPKFYFFDTGISRALSGLCGVEVRKTSKEYGNLFESFFINELFRLNEYLQSGYRFSYLRTKDGLEIDLIVEKPRQPPILIEIKSAERVDETALNRFQKLKRDLQARDFWVACQETRMRSTGVAEILPWREVVNRLFS